MPLNVVSPLIRIRVSLTSVFATLLCRLSPIFKIILRFVLAFGGAEVQLWPSLLRPIASHIPPLSRKVMDDTGMMAQVIAVSPIGDMTVRQKAY